MQSFLKSIPIVSSRDMVNISCTIVSKVFVISNDLVKYFSWSLYIPMPSNIPSNCPLMTVMGVFSSCDTAEKKSVRACSSAFSFSISASNFLLAFCKSDNAVERLRDNLLRLFSNTPNSSVRCSSICHCKCKSDIFSDIRLISNTGFVIMREYSHDTTIRLQGFWGSNQGSSQRTQGEPEKGMR